MSNLDYFIVIVYTFFFIGVIDLMLYFLEKYNTSLSKKQKKLTDYLVIVMQFFLFVSGIIILSFFYTVISYYYPDIFIFALMIIAFLKGYLTKLIQIKYKKLNEK